MQHNTRFRHSVVQGAAIVKADGTREEVAPSLPVSLRPLDSWMCLARKPSCPTKKLMLTSAFCCNCPRNCLKQPSPSNRRRVTEAASSTLQATWLPKKLLIPTFSHLEDFNCLSGPQRFNGVCPTEISSRLSSSLLFENPADMP